jgi:hypothetical protein
MYDSELQECTAENVGFTAFLQTLWLPSSGGLPNVEANIKSQPRQLKKSNCVE